MERRNFLKICSAGTVAVMGSHLGLKSTRHRSVLYEDFDSGSIDLSIDSQYLKSPSPNFNDYLSSFQKGKSGAASSQSNLRNYIAKMKAFEQTHQDDIFVDAEKYRLLLSTFKRLDRVQNLVGYGNFNVISFDETIKYSKRYSSIGAFKPAELAFLEEMFFVDAQQYGFFGEKVILKLTAKVPSRERFKVPHTGHFVYRGKSLESYVRVRKDIGDSIILTSGIRNVVKQNHLFLAKAIQSHGNLSRASRSLAPPGHSFHGVGDFDVGKVGFGRRNFTSDFAKTDEFKKLVDLGYINIRYPKNNLLGVRYEPWHIKVV